MKDQIHFRRIPRLVSGWLFAWIVIGCIACTVISCRDRGKSGSARGLNLLVVTIDTLRADRVGAYGYASAHTPTLDRLAAGGVFFKNAYTPVPLTLPAHCSLFTGRYPPSHGVRNNGNFRLPDGEITLAEVMKNRGYRTQAVIASYVLLSPFGLGQGFDAYDDSLNYGEMVMSYDSEIKANQVHEKFRRWLAKRPRAGERDNFFTWIHFYDPHSPYDPPVEYKNRFPSTLDGRYDGEISFADHYLGKIIDDLTAAGMWDKTVVVVAGDHGEAFGEHREFGHSIFGYEENLRVPLIFYNRKLWPGGIHSDARVSLIDLMPTLLELFGVKGSETIQGKSLVPLLSGGREESSRTLYFESMYGQEELGWASLSGIMKDSWKWISLPEPELYDLSVDKRETQNLFWKKNTLAKKMDQLLADTFKGCISPPSDARRELSESDRLHLRTLGYISAFSEKSDSRLDPKQGILLQNQFNEIERLIDAGDLDNAQERLDRLAGRYKPEVMPQFFGQWDAIHRKRGNSIATIENWKQAIIHFPANDNFKNKLAFELFEQNRLAESVQEAMTILKTNPRYTRAHILLGRIAERQRRFGDAALHLENGLKIEPNNVSLKISYAKNLALGGDRTKAASVCEQLLAGDEFRGDSQVNARIGMVYAEMGRVREALKLLEDSVHIRADDAETWSDLGILLFRIRDFRKAESAYRKSLSLNPKLAKTLQNLGTLYLTQFLDTHDPGFLPRALDSFHQALAVDPVLVSALNGRGSAFRFMGRVGDALKDWKRAASLDPGFVDAYFNIGTTCLRMNARKEAFRYLNLCKRNCYPYLPDRDRRRLDQLLDQAGE